MSSYNERIAIFKEIEAARKSKVILYVTGDRPGMETQISDVASYFVDHLDAIWPCDRISLILHTNGGNTAAAWQLVNLLRTFCNDLEIIVPAKALSAGTLISLGANRIIMTKQATLGPIDPSLNGPLNPQVAGTSQRVPVSVEAIQGYIDVVKDTLNISESTALSSIWNNLSVQIHPLVLGQIFRTRQQIRNLANKLLEHQKLDVQQVTRIVSFLCSESGSHDHSINRREARELGLTVENPTAELYTTLRQLEQSYVEELALKTPWTPDTELAGALVKDYSVPRAMIESATYGSHKYVSEGSLAKVDLTQNNIPQFGYQDDRKFESWRKEH